MSPADGEQSRWLWVVVGVATVVLLAGCAMSFVLGAVFLEWRGSSPGDETDSAERVFAANPDLRDRLVAWTADNASDLGAAPRAGEGRDTRSGETTVTVLGIGGGPLRLDAYVAVGAVVEWSPREGAWEPLDAEVEVVRVTLRRDGPLGLSGDFVPTSASVGSMPGMIDGLPQSSEWPSWVSKRREQLVAALMEDTAPYAETGPGAEREMTDELLGESPGLAERLEAYVLPRVSEDDFFTGELEPGAEWDYTFELIGIGASDRSTNAYVLVRRRSEWAGATYHDITGYRVPLKRGVNGLRAAGLVNANAQVGLTPYVDIDDWPAWAREAAASVR